VKQEDFAVCGPRPGLSDRPGPSGSALSCLAFCKAELIFEPYIAKAFLNGTAPKESRGRSESPLVRPQAHPLSTVFPRQNVKDPHFAAEICAQALTKWCSFVYNAHEV
ncbi:MAG: hypothetical protein IJK28_08860, partial [Clostridia bacterium]|nr:hypothetical protein [Clostridia bacterium]